MTRTIRTSGTPPAAPSRPLRTARRMNLTPATNGQRTTTTSTHQGKNVTVSESTQDERIPARRFGPGEEPAFVRVSAGKTINLGNYESLRIDVSVTLPCLPEEIDHTYETASGYVAEKLVQEESYILGDSRPSTRKASRRG